MTIAWHDACCLKSTAEHLHRTSVDGLGVIHDPKIKMTGAYSVQYGG
jgi:hypothetical protein